MSALDFQIMGVINVTPDSFSDGGRYLDPAAAIAHGLQLEQEGADSLDIGGESTRPWSEGVSVAEERRRVLPVIEGLIAAGTSAQLSIDTSKVSVARDAVQAGATLVNDVTAFRNEPEMAALVAETRSDCCLMHMLGSPRTMQEDPRYDDVVTEVKAFLEERMAFAISQGVDEERILLDPGIGFGKTREHNLELLRRLDELAAIGRPVVIGTSRKSFLGAITGREVEDRLAASIASNVLAYVHGARVFRVHDVQATRDALLVAAATVTAPWTTTMPRSSTT